MEAGGFCPTTSPSPGVHHHPLLPPPPPPPGAEMAMRTVSAGRGRPDSPDAWGMHLMFCLLKADWAGHNMFEENWNAEAGDKPISVLPFFEQVWSGSPGAVCFSPPSFLHRDV